MKDDVQTDGHDEACERAVRCTTATSDLNIMSMGMAVRSCLSLTHKHGYAQGGSSLCISKLDISEVAIAFINTGAHILMPVEKGGLAQSLRNQKAYGTDVESSLSVLDAYV